MLVRGHGRFDLMNRRLEGHGIKGQDALFEDLGAARARDGYAPLPVHLPVSPSE